jgi:hypothetical protein
VDLILEIALLLFDALISWLATNDEQERARSRWI